MLTNEQLAAIEKRRGYKLTDLEILRGEADRRPDKTGPRLIETRTPAQAERDNVLAYVSDAQAAADAEAFRALPPAKQKLQTAIKVAKEVMAKRAKFDAMRAAEEKLKNPDPAKKAELDKLDALRETVAFDPSWSYEEFAMLDEAKRQLAEKPLAEAQKFLQEVFALKTSKDATAAKGMRDQAATLEQQLAALRQQADTLDPPKPPSVDLSAINGAWDRYWEAKKEFGQDSPEATAALGEWNGAIDSVGGIAAVREAEAAAAQAGGGSASNE
jgi:hypothetical protein